MKKILSLIAVVMVSGLAYGQAAYTFKFENLARKSRFASCDSLISVELEKAKKKENTKATKYAELYNLGAKAAFSLVHPELLKGAAGNPFDTTLFISKSEQALDYTALSHDYDMRPAKPGAEPKPQFVSANKEIVMKMLDQWYFAGFFFLESDKARAAEYFLKYTQSYKHPVFTQAEQDSIYNAKKDNYSKSAFNAAWTYYELKDWDNMLKATEVVLKDTFNMHTTYLMTCEALLVKGDTVTWLKTLEDAIARDKNNEQFIEWLQAYYLQTENVAAAEQTAKRYIELHPEDATGYFMMGAVELNMKKDYTKSREYSEKALSIEPNNYRILVNLGASYVNEMLAKVSSGAFKYVGHPGKAVPAKDKALYDKELSEFKTSYEKARGYYEKVRELEPSNSRLWAYPLYVCYGNLGMEANANEMKSYLDN